jgi:hypothetical protein
MALYITDVLMASDVPGCTAVAAPHPDGWSVTGFPGPLTRNQAVTAMVLAEVYAIEPPPSDPIWRHVPGWLRELGLPEGWTGCR